MSDKKPLTPKQRQEFIDQLPAEKTNPQAKETFDKLITKAAQPQKPEQKN